MQTVARLLTDRPSRFYFRVLVLCAARDETRNVASELISSRFHLAPNGRLFRNNLIVDVRTTGLGMVHAAANASLHIERLHPDVLVNVGRADAPHLEPGDVVVGKTCAPPPLSGGSAVFESDPTLVAMAARMPVPLAPLEERGSPPRVHVGHLAPRTGRAGEDCHHCEDTEAAAVATVARDNDIPFVMLKDVLECAEKHPHAGRNAAAVAARLCYNLADMTD